MGRITMKIKSGYIAVMTLMMISTVHTSAFADDGGLRHLEKTQAQLTERQEKAKENTAEQMVKETESVQEEAKEQKS